MQVAADKTKGHKAYADPVVTAIAVVAKLRPESVAIGAITVDTVVASPSRSNRQPGVVGLREETLVKALGKRSRGGSGRTESPFARRRAARPSARPKARAPRPLG